MLFKLDHSSAGKLGLLASLFIVVNATDGNVTTLEAIDFENLDQSCRRFPLWPGRLREACHEHTGWKNPHQPEWWDNFNDETMGPGRRKQMELCVQEEFETYMKSWPKCQDEANIYHNLCFVPESQEPTINIHSEDGPVGILENALSPHEGFAVEAVATCIKQYFPWKTPYVEDRGFGEEHERYGEGGNLCTFLAGFMQTFAPGVVAQTVKVGNLIYRALRNRRTAFQNRTHPPPEFLGIRTLEHLDYSKSGHLGLHIDAESCYTISMILSDPSSYEGGEFRLQSGDELYKKDPLTAIMFDSHMMHGVNPVLGGNRKSFVTEFWEFFDSPITMARPDNEKIIDWYDETAQEHGY
eukprot:CAMPEP_0118678920 /NCGR_PEP_ID=MMETSP0800-20121206/3493_1 /TAXON_ID=210618 ORGANISM="Striatella unipunctata, Strain CCMP2910" /NCGR_SAMPLE_ID=MMETSP0800 /ASSEMBLY_ACC=CAM_ASM_000638 /LENGTH=353 /DNA_ID=CAMNT_0006574843 /DNA_START=57 /DNA_END=1118 /DNA_ORIENTATION=-